MSAEVLAFGVLAVGAVACVAVSLAVWIGREVARERRMAAQAKDAAGPPIRERGRDA